MLVDECGRIAEIGPDSDVPNPPSARTLDCPNAAALPGLVNLHTHLELTGLRGAVPDEDFFAWIGRVRNAKESLSEAEFAAAAVSGLRETWHSGTTTVADTGTSGATVTALSELGGRGIYYQEAIAPDPSRCDATMQSLRASVEQLQNSASDSVTVGVSPHAPYTVSPQLYAAVASYARTEGLPLAAHLAESRAEWQLITLGEGQFAGMWRDRAIPPIEPARSSIEYVQRFGILGRDLLAIHCVHVDEADLSHMSELNVPVAACPRSNLRHGHGYPPLADFIGANLRIGFGTDSAASVDSLDIRMEAKLAHERSGLSAVDCVRMLTLDGAAAVGLDGETGSLDPGKWADICLIELSDTRRRATELLACDLLDSVASPVAVTIVGGRVVYRGGD